MYNLGPAFKTMRTVFVTFAVRPKNMDVNTNCKEQLCFLKLELGKNPEYNLPTVVASIDPYVMKTNLVKKKNK